MHRRGVMRLAAGASAPPALTLPTTGLVLRLDPTTAKTVVDDSGSGGYAQAISAWANGAGGVNATQGTAARRPQLVTHGTLGECAYLAGSQVLSITGLAITGGRYTIYAALDLTSDTSQDQLIDWQTSRLICRTNQNSASNGLGIYTGAYTAEVPSTSGVQLLRYTIAATDTNGSKIHRNSVQIAQGTAASVAAGASGAAAIGARYDGAANFIVAHLRALYVYQASHDNTAAGLVEAYMRQETPGLPS